MITPIGSYVLIKPTVIEERTMHSGLIIPRGALAKEAQTRTGTVVALGDGLQIDGSTTPFFTAIGDTVVFGKFAGLRLTLVDTEYILMREDSILAVDDEGNN